MKEISKNPYTANFATVRHESDRGCVLLVAAFFDNLLANILKQAISPNVRNDPSAKKFFEGLFGDRGPLYGFANKIKIAYAFKLISKEQFLAINVIRELRNEAAHKNFHFTLENKGVKIHLKKLNDYEDVVSYSELRDGKATAKGSFVDATSNLFFQIFDKMVEGFEVR